MKKNIFHSNVVEKHIINMKKYTFTRETSTGSPLQNPKICKKIKKIWTLYIEARVENWRFTIFSYVLKFIGISFTFFIQTPV